MLYVLYFGSFENEADIEVSIVETTQYTGNLDFIHWLIRVAECLHIIEAKKFQAHVES
jgi:hypothetical protein